MAERVNSEQVLKQQQAWVDEWAKMMVQIWRDKLEFFHIRRTGALAGSFSERVSHAGLSANINLKFLEYGIYQAAGTGNGYKRGNGGDLEFLDKAYRHAHRLDEPRKVGPAWGGYWTSGEPREKRDWLNPKLYASLMRMKEAMARIVGEEAGAVICDALEDNRRAVK